MPWAKLKELTCHLVEDLGWDPVGRLALECHTADKVYHRGVSPVVVALHSEQRYLAKLLREKKGGLEPPADRVESTIPW